MAESQKNATDVLASYRRWKEDGEALKARAQGLLMDRFAELIREAQQVQHDLWEDFGQIAKFPVNPKLTRKGKGRGSQRRPSSLPRPASSQPASSNSVAIPAAAHEPRVATPAPRKVSGSNEGSKSGNAEARKTIGSAPLRAPAAIPARTRIAAPKPVRNPEAEREKQRRSLMRQISKTQLRLSQARTTGDPVRIQNAEDRLYELNDDLRLLDQSE